MMYTFAYMLKIAVILVIHPGYTVIILVGIKLVN